MFNFFKKSNNDLKNTNGDVIEKSSLVKGKHGERFLKLNDDTCAIVLHPNNNVEVIFTKLYDPNTQYITENEEALMALALFMKQPGFLPMIIDEFRKIARERISSLTNNEENK